MRILVDYRAALRERTGVGEYLHTLIGAYQRRFHDDLTIFSSSWKDRLDPRIGTALHGRIVDRRVPVRVLNYLWHRAEWPPVEALAGAADVVHSWHPLLLPARQAAQVITVHDLHFLDHPERTAAEIRRDYPELTPNHARRADAIVTPSAYTRQQVADRFGVSLDRIYACSPAAPQWDTLGRTPNVPADGYVLFLGTLEPRKNLGVLLDAYEQLAHAGAPLRSLVLAGRAAPEAQPWLDRIMRPPLARYVRHLGYVATDERERLFSGARALVLPSLEEGFGLTALEAMAAGIPVLASNRGSLPEVVGDGGTLIDPEDASAWAAAIDRVGADDTWATAMGEAGLARARTFTWDRAATTLRQAYEDAIRRRQER